jgi:pyruvate/2-oxoglutarate dehydrogenase complex dihydrolipoamide acyltransferase (E2) component
VFVGDPPVDIETDKTVSEVEAEAAGMVRKLFAAGGEQLPVEASVGLIGGRGEQLPLPRSRYSRRRRRPNAAPAGSAWIFRRA